MKVTLIKHSIQANLSGACIYYREWITTCEYLINVNQGAFTNEAEILYSQNCVNIHSKYVNNKFLFNFNTYSCEDASHMIG